MKPNLLIIIAAALVLGLGWMTLGGSGDDDLYNLPGSETQTSQSYRPETANPSYPSGSGSVPRATEDRDGEPVEVFLNEDGVDINFIPDAEFGDAPQPPDSAILLLVSLSNVSQQLDYLCEPVDEQTIRCRFGLMTIELVTQTPVDAATLSHNLFYPSEDFTACEATDSFYDRLAAAERGGGDPGFSELVKQGEPVPLEFLRTLARDRKSYCATPSESRKARARELFRQMETRTCAASHFRFELSFKRVSAFEWQSGFDTDDACGTGVDIRFRFDPQRQNWSVFYTVSVANPQRANEGTECFASADATYRYASGPVPAYTRCDWITYNLPVDPPEGEETGSGGLYAFDLAGRSAHARFRCTTKDGAMKCSIASTFIDRITKAWTDERLEKKIDFLTSQYTFNCPYAPALFMELNALEDGTLPPAITDSLANPSAEAESYLEGLRTAHATYCITPNDTTRAMLRDEVAKRLRTACAVDHDYTVQSFTTPGADRWTYTVAPEDDDVCEQSETGTFSRNPHDQGWMLDRGRILGNPDGMEAANWPCTKNALPQRHYEAHRMPAWTGCTSFVFD